MRARAMLRAAALGLGVAASAWGGAVEVQVV